MLCFGPFPGTCGWCEDRGGCWFEVAGRLCVYVGVGASAGVGFGLGLGGGCGGGSLEGWNEWWDGPSFPFVYGGNLRTSIQIRVPGFVVVPCPRLLLLCYGFDGERRTRSRNNVLDSSRRDNSIPLRRHPRDIQRGRTRALVTTHNKRRILFWFVWDERTGDGGSRLLRQLFRRGSAETKSARQPTGRRNRRIGNPANRRTFV